jgi:hypothetical protein
MYNRNTPSIRDLMADPLVRSVMIADHVDAGALEAMLNAQARAIVERRESAGEHGALMDGDASAWLLAKRALCETMMCA